MFKFRKQMFRSNMKINAAQVSGNQAQQLSADLATNEQTLKELFINCSDFNTRPIYINGEAKIILFYIDGLTDTKTVDMIFLKPMMFNGLPDGLDKSVTMGELVEQQLFANTPVKTISEFKTIVDSLLKGELCVLVEDEAKALVADMKAAEHRSIEEPSTEVAIRGPKDGFTETLRTNTVLLRKRIRSTRLKLEALTIGELSQTDVVIAYIEGLASDSLLQEVRDRLKRIEIDGILESEYIEELIEDEPFTPFPQIQNTERPDIVTANLLEGKVAILVDNTPFALIVPMTFWNGMQAVEDYYERFIYSSFIRFLRYIMYNTAIFLPSLYVALTTYHPKLLPTTLLISVAAAREGTPFPTIIEALIMEFVFEGLREAGIRLPKAIGSAVSIVGALVIGQAAVQAGIVSAPMVIVVAATGIASFSIPRYNLGTAIRIIRFPMLILAGIFGLYGVAIGFIALTIHLVNLRSFGVPYFTPVAPQIPADLKDVLMRAPRWANRFGPLFTFGRMKPRIASNQKPKPKVRGNKP
ncbi:spore germination protein [Bacillus benzoevorans]